ncbi:hypothetical protein BBJ28_00005042 [Nothophytophthora sp. Chile5]|nr:hypothetical protein BBJ28_00005042 [Nothophytophthora sp. Chile5]
MAVRESSEGVSGRLTLDLARGSYAPGEVLSGSVSLSALEQIQAREPLTVVVQGREAVGWDDGGDCPATNAFDKTFLKHKIVLTPDLTSYSAGDSLYPFSFQLPMGLASTFALENVYSGSMERLRVHVTYQVSVWLTVDSESVAYLQATQEFTVHAPPTITPPARALEVSTSETVHWLCCLDRGSLQLVVETPRDALVAGEVVSLTCRVNNSACKASVSCLSVELVEEIALRNVGARPELVATRVLSRQQVAGPVAGQILEQTVEVEVVEGEKQRPLLGLPVRAAPTDDATQQSEAPTLRNLRPTERSGLGLQPHASMAALQSASEEGGPNMADLLAFTDDIFASLNEREAEAPSASPSAAVGTSTPPALPQRHNAVPPKWKRKYLRKLTNEDSSNRDPRKPNTRLLLQQTLAKKAQLETESMQLRKLFHQATSHAAQLRDLLYSEHKLYLANSSYFKIFKSLSLPDCQQIHREALADVRAFSLQEQFAHLTGEICGWRETRTDDRSFFSFAMHKTFYRASAQHLMTVMWQIMSNPARWEKLYSPVINMRIRLVQRVDKDNLVLFHDYCAMDADNDLTVLHCMYLVSRLPTANGGYLVSMRGLDWGRLVVEDLAKRAPAPAEGVGETLELWTNNFCWYAVGPGGRDAQATLSGMTPTLCTNAYFWISEIVQVVLRCEMKLVGPVFTLPQ